MKNIKKNEIAIYAIALMLVAAGYFNYIKFEPKTKDTYSEDITENEIDYANVGDAVLVSSNNDSSLEVDSDVQEEENIDSNQINTNINNSDNSDAEYYVNSKMEREKMYAEMITNYQNIINNQNVSEVQKTIATEEIKKINNIKNAIMIAENLIMNKGFENCIIFVNDKNVNIVVHILGGLDTEKTAKIQNIISRELSTEIENIHITER